MFCFPAADSDESEDDALLAAGMKLPNHGRSCLP